MLSKTSEPASTSSLMRSVGSKKRDNQSKTPLKRGRSLQTQNPTLPQPALIPCQLARGYRRFRIPLPDGNCPHNHPPRNRHPTSLTGTSNTSSVLSVNALGEDISSIPCRSLIYRSRLTRINERLERDLSELRAIVDASPASKISSISFIRSPALPSPALPTVSPSGFSVRSSGERDMDISSTPLHLPSTLSDEEGQAHNHLSDFEFFLGPTQPPSPNNSSMNAEPSGNEPTHPDSQEGGISRSANRPSSAPPDIDDTHPSALLSPFQLSTSLPPRSRSVEPRSERQERILEIQRELDTVNDDLVTKNKDLNELRELVHRLKDQAI